MKNLKTLVVVGNQNEIDKTGIEQTEALLDVADKIVDLYGKVMEDGKINQNDIKYVLEVPELVTLARDVKYSEVDDELLDIDEEEDKILEARLSKYTNKQAYVNLVSGLIEAAGAVADLVKK